MVHEHVKFIDNVYKIKFYKQAKKPEKFFLIIMNIESWMEILPQITQFFKILNT